MLWFSTPERTRTDIPPSFSTPVRTIRTGPHSFSTPTHFATSKCHSSQLCIILDIALQAHCAALDDILHCILYCTMSIVLYCMRCWWLHCTLHCIVYYNALYATLNCKIHCAVESVWCTGRYTALHIVLYNIQSIVWDARVCIAHCTVLWILNTILHHTEL